MKKTMMLLIFLVSVATLPAHALRCGNALVAEGDHKTEVLRKCGDPINVDIRFERRNVVDPHHGSHRPDYDRVYPTAEVEEWTYNFGPQRFMQLLRFENGILKEIRDLDRGY